MSETHPHQLASGIFSELIFFDANTTVSRNMFRACLNKTKIEKTHEIMCAYKVCKKWYTYLTTHSRHFIYGYIASGIWYRTTQLAREETRYCHIGYSFRLATRVLLYASSHRQDNTYHSLCYSSRGALAGMRNSSTKHVEWIEEQELEYRWQWNRLKDRSCKTGRNNRRYWSLKREKREGEVGLLILFLKRYHR